MWESISGALRYMQVYLQLGNVLMAEIEASGNPVNMVDWLNKATLDIIGLAGSFSFPYGNYDLKV